MAVRRARRGDAENDFGGFLEGIGALVMGSTTYEWIVEHENLVEHPEKWFYPGKPAFVLSSRDLCRSWPAPTSGSHRRRGASSGTRSSRPRGDATSGSSAAATSSGQFADAGLLDEMRVSVAPVTLVSGRPLLPRRLESDRLRLESVRQAGQFAELVYSVRNRADGGRSAGDQASSARDGSNVVHVAYFGSRPSPDDVPVRRRRTQGPTCCAVVRRAASRAGGQGRQRPPVGRRLHAERREHARGDAMVAARVHVQPVLRPVRGGRQLAIRPVERADDVGAIRDGRGDGLGEQVAAALEHAAQRKLARRIGAREDDELHALLVAALEHVRERVDDARDARAWAGACRCRRR